MKFHDYYMSRENAIKKCVESAKADLEKSKKSNASLEELKEKRTNLRIFQEELDIESINRSRSLKVKF